MFAWLKRIYNKLPLIRDITHVQESVDGLSRSVESVERSVLRLAQEMFLRTLLSTDRYSDPNRLSRFEYRPYSLNGEDGVLQEVFRRIGVKDRHFLKTGVDDGLENNTAFLLNQGWQVSG